MKKLFIVFGMAAVLAAPAAQAIDGFMPYDALVSTIAPMDVINWKVGDTASFSLKLGFISGTNVKLVTKDEGAALWMTQDMNLMIQKQKVEALINKADGKILKLLVNGQEQQIPDEKIEIISQDYVEIKVPAGTFQAVHIIAKTTSSPKLEVWINPRDTALDGTLKQIAQTQMGNMTLELTSFKRMP